MSEEKLERNVRDLDRDLDTLSKGEKNASI